MIPPNYIPLVKASLMAKPKVNREKLCNPLVKERMEELRAMINIQWLTFIYCSLCAGLGFSPWVRKICWRKKWEPTPLFLPEKSHGQRSLVGYSPGGRRELDMTEQLHTHTCAGLYSKHWGRHFICYYTDEETEAHRLKGLAKVTSKEVSHRHYLGATSLPVPWFTEIVGLGD